MADDSQMMDDLSALADAHQETKKPSGPNKIATGPGSGPQRGRRQASSAPVMAMVRPRKIPNAPSAAKIWGWAFAGLGLLFLGILALAKGPSGHKLVGLLWGLGFFAIAFSRGYSRQVYEVEKMKDKNSPQAWKIPLLAVQGLLLFLLSFYLLLYAFGKLPMIHNAMALTSFFLFFLLYGYWFLTSYVINRVPGQASHLFGIIALGLSATCFLAWIEQLLMLSVILGGFAILFAVSSLLSAPKASYESRFGRLFLPLAFLLCLPAVIGILPIGSNSKDVLDLARTYQGIQGFNSALTYSPDGRVLAMAQQKDKTWNLLFLQGGEEASPVLTVQAGDDIFRPVFIYGGRAVVCDFQVGGQRNLYMVDTVSGRTTPITREGIYPNTQGVSWSEATGRFLYVVQDGGAYEIRSVSPAQPFKPVVLHRDEHPMRSPSWYDGGKKIVWVGGAADDMKVVSLDLAEKKLFVLANATNTMEESNLTPQGAEMLGKLEEKLEKSAKLKVALAPKGPSLSRLTFAIPAPDDFRVLYGLEQGKKTQLWAVLMDGTKATPIYQSKGEIGQCQWMPDGQQVVFEEFRSGCSYFFRSEIPNVVMLEANTGKAEPLILPKVAHRSPAVSPDSAKVAFLGNSNLWYPSFLRPRTGVWVAVVR